MIVIYITSSNLKNKENDGKQVKIDIFYVIEF